MHAFKLTQINSPENNLQIVSQSKEDTRSKNLNSAKES